ncbi:MAG: MFS transporter [Anaerolineae bacterium]
MATAADLLDAPISEKEYRSRVWGWAMYDWANSAFATTILAAVLPVYFSAVAAATLNSEATATGYWSLGLSISLLLTAILSPFLGTLSDVRRSKKRFLGIFAVIGIVATGLLVLIDRGDWVAALLLFVVARIGFVGSYTFYDALLPHVARPDDQDRVSALGYALGYLGGGLLLAINVVMIFVLPGTWGPRLAFLSVALWWAIFSIPIFRRVPEPNTISSLKPGDSVTRASLRRMSHTFRDLRRYRELFKYLVAFLLYNDAIGTIIGLATIYGAELGFGSTELVLALLLVQFVGIPFSLIFGRLPDARTKLRPFFLAFILFNMIALPLVGIGARYALPADLVGAPPAQVSVTTDASADTGDATSAEAPAAAPAREQSLPLILGIIAVVQVAAAAFAAIFGRFFRGMASLFDTKRSIMLALVVYSIIAIWGFFIESTVEFWLLAWMVAIVQGGSQALSRSLFSNMSPREKSGEFFGLYGVMEKFSSILGPLLFALAVVVFGSSRPAILSLIAFFIIGGWLLSRVNVKEGQRVAAEEDQAMIQARGLVT